MKAKFILSFLILTMSLMATAQPAFEKPDYTKIKKDIKDKKADNYFPKLMERFTARDTTMTEENYRNLYFGFMFQEAYNPYSRSSKTDDLRKYSDLEKLDKKDLKDAIELMDKIYKEEPFNLNVMNMQAYACQLDGNVDMAKKIAGTLGKIIDVIFSSGDGKTCETAFHVQSISHEYLLLSILGLEGVSQSLIKNCDYIQFEKDKYKIAGIYFDISKMQESMMAAFGK